MKYKLTKQSLAIFPVLRSMNLMKMPDDIDLRRGTNWQYAKLCQQQELFVFCPIKYGNLFLQAILGLKTV